MEVIGFIILLFIGFILIGGIGLILNVIGFIFNLLFQGFTTSIGCLVWIFIIIILIIGLGAA